ncbi:MAG: hypothetical protein AB7J35_19980 [Dehalococcoidia bacterium]
MPTISKQTMEMVMTDGEKLFTRIADAGEMAFLRVTLPANTDFTPALEAAGGPQRCGIPHWMYVLSGALRIRYNDGREEVGHAGEFIHAIPGHTALCDVDTEFIEVSPRAAIRDLLAKMTGAAASA